jgi:hypothetical protein
VGREGRDKIEKKGVFGEEDSHGAAEGCVYRYEREGREKEREKVQEWG